MANRRRRLTGVVTRDKMDKTVVVEVKRTTVHPLYRKVMRVASRYMAHDEKNDAKVGDKVVIVESRPLSKRKRWMLEKVLVRVSGSPESELEPLVTLLLVNPIKSRVVVEGDISDIGWPEPVISHQGDI